MVGEVCLLIININCRHFEQLDCSLVNSPDWTLFHGCAVAVVINSTCQQIL